MTKTIVKWKWVSTFEGEYMVSNYGDICSFKHRIPKIVKPDIASNGYQQVTLYKDAEKVRFTVHDLVANAFIGIRPAKKEINHIDGVKTNNLFSNLEYVSSSENTIHSYENKLQPKGENHGQAKLTLSQVNKIKNAYPKKSQYELAKEYNVHQTTIGRIVREEIWNQESEKSAKRVAGGQA